MSQPLLLLLQRLASEQIRELKELATNYQVVTEEEVDETIDLDHVEIVFGWNKKIGDQLLASQTSRLRWIQAYSAGVDYFDLTTLKDKNILLTNASGVHSIPITESVIGMLLTHYRKIGQAQSLQEKKEWASHLPSEELANKKMLIVGTGQIGQHLATVAKVFGVTLYGISRSGRQLDHFEKVFPQAKIDQIIGTMDIVVNILPLTPDTHHFYSTDLFEKMKTGVVFINVGRGPSVNTKALIESCQSGKISFAALDVFEEEPLSATSKLWELDNLLITPHISGNTDQYDTRTLAIFKENIQAYQQNHSLVRNLVDLNNGY